MKKTLYIFLSVVLPLLTFGQAGHQKGDSSPGKADPNEPLLENASKDSTVVKLNVFLEGPFDKGKMITELNKKNLVPLNQPYNISPWNYNGNESVNEIPNIDVVDWVLVDIRSADSAGAATSSTIFARKAGFLLSSGSICNPDGSSLLSFDTVFS